MRRLELSTARVGFYHALHGWNIVLSHHSPEIRRTCIKIRRKLGPRPEGVLCKVSREHLSWPYKSIESANHFAPAPLRPGLQASVSHLLLPVFESSFSVLVVLIPRGPSPGVAFVSGTVGGTRHECTRVMKTHFHRWGYFNTML